MRRLFLVLIVTIVVMLAFPLLVASAWSGAPLQEPWVNPVIVGSKMVSANSGAPLQAEPAPPINLKAFLQWLIGGGGSILAVSWLLERMKWFQALAPDAKDYTIFGAAVAVGCGALAIVTYVPPAILDAMAPYFLIVGSTFATVFIAKLFHKADKPA